ncbi:hypothetical protein AC578_9865 [Pseudocercospora eumusae]|uniref:Uncharacterized protein n=1 Tax=Pseudocercospora eumusae TaxID=321146 RepID=A0A139HB61_9PEZI|nr:hypothetical protein AC578_9865 [Pseudocercospora eumusae]
MGPMISACTCSVHFVAVDTLDEKRENGEEEGGRKGGKDNGMKNGNAGDNIVKGSGAATA